LRRSSGGRRVKSGKVVGDVDIELDWNCFGCDGGSEVAEYEYGGESEVGIEFGYGDEGQ